ncbi:UvrD-helicase domain-containing protein [Litchfieldia alkalitelluris]|uniref:UvrD-helicase domain-containing protein n=1 Tax=Litchfieldia alkalitelluris TaxID=304268 RepID=UPI00099826CC|nr:UvrD-helicase domain-containing protein [Litchfieldia alkalitelluris]
MKVLALEKFFKSVPGEKQGLVNERVKAFVKELSEKNYNYKSVLKGYSSRKVESLQNNILKFPVGSDRVLYTYGSELPFIGKEYHHCIVLLEYSNHDKQIRTARNREFTKQRVVDYKMIEESENNENTVEKQLVNLSYEDSIVRIFEVEELEKVFGDSEYFYHLNEEQTKIVKLKDKGEFVFGSAGSGKTTIGVYKIVEFLQNLNHPDIKLCYFTFSRNLKDRTERFFEKLAGELYGMSRNEFHDKVDFFTVEEYLEQMSGGTAKIITYEKFIEWYKSYIPGHNFDESALWKERRGIFQGMIGKNWQYEIEVPVSGFDKKLLKVLAEHEYIKWNKTKKSFQLTQELNAICSNIDKKFGDSQDFRQQVVKCYNLKISAKKELSEQEYLELNESYSLFSKGDRAKVCKHYKSFAQHVHHLGKVDFVEEGELVRALLPETQSVYDYIIIDEVQDLTELQVYYLCQLVKDKKNVYVCGDFNQTINPTFFKIGRIESIFKFLGGLTSFEETTLQKNYRSSKDIVKLANELAELRGSSFTTKLDYEYTEKAVRENTKKPYLYVGEQSDLFSYIKDKSYVSVVVGSSQTKSELKLKYPEIATRILTVSEIKGIERKYIITYNLLSDYKEQWDEIFKKLASNSKLNSELYRYYFNIFYVGITRARDVLGMVEDDLSEGMRNWLVNKVDIVQRFDVDQLSLQEGSTIMDFLNEAFEYEEMGLLQDAIEAYRSLIDLNDDAIKTRAELGVKRCETKVDFQNDKNYTKCGERLLKLKQYDEAVSYLRQDKNGNPKALLTAILKSTTPERFNTYKELERLNTNPLKVLTEIGDEDLTRRFIKNEIKPFSVQMDELVRQSTKAKEVFVTINR